ncbi:hypothetical protein [Deinococcus misasensis]|uniref:hypothetical protein n=1 Tax=Deinococcus misasensis TaxID=392413 RepID=UPI0005530CC8|nr:hypothetical protein [Deinococcus misasensis]
MLDQIIKELFEKATEGPQEKTVQRGLVLRASIKEGVRLLLLGRLAPETQPHKGPSDAECAICAKHAGFRYFEQTSGWSRARGMHWKLLTETKMPASQRETYIQQIVQSMGNRDLFWNFTTSVDALTAGLRKLSDEDLETSYARNVLRKFDQEKA